MLTVTVRNPSAAPGAIVIATDRLVDPGDVITPETPAPLKVTAVAPERFGAKMAALTVLPGAPVVGYIVAEAGVTTLNPLKGALVPAGVVTVTERKPNAAPGAIVIATDKLVRPDEVITAETPVPLNVTPLAPEKLCPKMVAAMVVPGAPVDEDSEVMTGPPTVNPLNGAVVADGVVTVTVRNPNAAPGATVSVTDTLDSVPVPKTVVTPAPLKATPVAPDKFCP